MRRTHVVLALVLAAASIPALAQSEPQAENPQAEGAEAASGAQLAPRLDALILYRQGRDLETAGKQAESQAKYQQAIAICDQEIAATPKRIEAYVVKCWSLFRQGKHAEVISNGQIAMKITFDARISEVMGESYYFLGKMDDSIKALQKYIEIASDSGDRGPTALFFMGEAYLRLKKYEHADIAYSAAVTKEPNMPRWWFRLGNTCESLGEWKRAFDAYAKALALNPAYQDALTAQARVKGKIAP